MATNNFDVSELTTPRRERKSISNRFMGTLFVSTITLFSVLQAEWWWCSKKRKSSSGGLLRVDLSLFFGGCGGGLLNEGDEDDRRRRLDPQPWWKTHPQPPHMQKSQKQLWQQKGAPKQWPKKNPATKGGTASAEGSGEKGSADHSYSSAAAAGGAGTDGFFKGSSGVKHGEAEWSHVDRAVKAGAPLWTSSWSPPPFKKQQQQQPQRNQRQGNNNHTLQQSASSDSNYPINGGDGNSAAFPAELEDLCGPFVHWLRESYAPRAKRRGPVVCSMPPHQGLGDQFKGVLRCWAAALVSQRPLLFSHGSSRSSWVWTDESMVAPLGFLCSEQLVDFNPASSRLPGKQGLKAAVSIAQDFAGAKLSVNLLPCEDGEAAKVGGLKPYHGLNPAFENVKRAAAASASSSSSSACAAMLKEAKAAVQALQDSKGDESFCVVRSLLEPQLLLRRTVEVALGQSLAVTTPTPKSKSGSTKSLGVESSQLNLPLPVIVGLHLRMQESIAIAHDIDWEVHCVGLVAAQLVERRRSSSKPHQLQPAVVFAVATDSPEQLERIRQRVVETAPICAPPPPPVSALPSSPSPALSRQRRTRKRRGRRRRLEKSVERGQGDGSERGSELRGEERRLAGGGVEARDTRGGREKGVAAVRRRISSNNSMVAASLPPPPPPPPPPAGVSLAPLLAVPLPPSPPPPLKLLSPPSSLPPPSSSSPPSPPSSSSSSSSRCVFVTMESVGTMGHVSNKETRGASSVSQRMWADWFMLSESETCVYSRSGFPRFACLASSRRAAARTGVFEKDICGTHREGALFPPPLDAGCEEPAKSLAERQCRLVGVDVPLTPAQEHRRRRHLHIHKGGANQTESARLRS